METTELTLYQKGETTLADIQEKVKTLQITDETLTLAGETIAVANRFRIALENERKEKKDPHLKQCQDIDTRYGLLVKPFTEIANKVEKMIAAFNREKREEARRRQEEYDQKVFEAEEKRVDEERRQKEEYDRKIAEEEARRQAESKKSIFRPFAKGEVAPVLPPLPPPEPIQAVYVPPPAPVEAPKEKIATTFGNVKIKERWTFEVVDLNLVPKEYLTVDEKAVNRAISAKDNPVREIPGLKIYPEE